MIKRIVEVSNPSYLHLKNKQLFIEQNHKVVAQVPIEDIGVLILEHSAINITQPLIIECQKNNTAIIFCDEKHLPYSTILPISEGNNLHQKILKQQINITEPVRKNLWKQVIQQKITNQANTLKQFDKSFMRLEKLANEVKSGDSTNCEGLAAQYYWKALFGKGFVRDQNAEGVNSVLNYGYSIIRAMIARSIVASGLHPAIGLFHHNQYNGLCLADDLMEPFRPWVDSIVYKLYQENANINITKEVKIPFLNLISENVKFKNKQMPLMISVHYLMADLKRNFAKESKRLVYPKK
ncbi:CRISPR-associated protein Cas1, partial [uncultured Gammaproteobacteria bacterium]|uniref:type II CRISPR-associated endonuclease Cas1 n=1 Tax=thiotrophic endosymbiont of Bathymodiolus puteoserpentis (Logatchev) TaxID=343240 RepID=UPI0010B0F412